MNSLSFSKSLSKQAYLPQQIKKKQYKVPNDDYKYHEVRINMGPITTPEYIRPQIYVTEQLPSGPTQPWPSIRSDAFARYKAYVEDSLRRMYGQRSVRGMYTAREPDHTPEPHEFCPRGT
jgi:hypothetical protein